MAKDADSTSVDLVTFLEKLSSKVDEFSSLGSKLVLSCFWLPYKGFIKFVFWSSKRYENKYDKKIKALVEEISEKLALF